MALTRVLREPATFHFDINALQWNQSIKINYRNPFIYDLSGGESPDVTKMLI